ncbi:MAG: hypothetical protein K2O47_03885, partial [Muribaculaceae bacterium]|nr:hypothetical protein [Muribaculaceae bacterium]
MKREKEYGQKGDASLEMRRRYVEIAASVGLLLVLAAMMAPFLGGLLGNSMPWAKWVYAGGALVYTVARVVNVN